MGILKKEKYIITTIDKCIVNLLLMNIYDKFNIDIRGSKIVNYHTTVMKNYKCVEIYLSFIEMIKIKIYLFFYNIKHKYNISIIKY